MLKSSDLEPYGYVYDHEGKSFAFHIVAGSREEADARLQSMRTAICLGRLRASQIADGCEGGDCSADGKAVKGLLEGFEEVHSQIVSLKRQFAALRKRSDRDRPLSQSQLKPGMPRLSIKP